MFQGRAESSQPQQLSRGSTKPCRVEKWPESALHSTSLPYLLAACGGACERERRKGKGAAKPALDAGF